MFRGPGKLPTVRSHDTHDTDRAAQAVLESELPSTWHRDAPKTGQEYGIDLLVQVIESHELTPTRFGIQLKGKLRPHVVGEAIHFSFPTKNLGTYLVGESLPVFLVVADTARKEAYFLFLQRFANESLRDEDWSDQETVTVHVPLANRVSDHARLLREVHEAADYMLAMRAAPEMVLNKRARAFESLDPRFRVEASATEAGASYVFHPRVNEPISFAINVGALDSARRGLLRRGFSVPVAHGEIAFSGLPAFDRLRSSITALRIAQTLECTATIETRRKKRRARLVNVPTRITRSLDETRISCSYENAPLDIDVALHFLPGSDDTAEVQIKVHQPIDQRWLGKRIDQLAHFDRLSEFATVAEGPYEIRLILHLPGQDDAELPWGGPILSNDRGSHDAFSFVVAQLRKLRAISDAADFHPTLPVTADVEVGEIDLVLALVTKGRYEGPARHVRLDLQSKVWSGYVERLVRAGDQLIDFDLPRGGFPVTWSVLGSQITVPIESGVLTKAKCTVVRRPDGLVDVSAVGTKRSTVRLVRHRAV